MPMIRLLISLPKTLKAKLDALRKQGTTSSGFIRSLLEREFQKSQRSKPKQP